jgi:hypothetical protein
LASRKPLIDKDEEAQKITAGDASLFKPFSTLPNAEQKVLLSLACENWNSAGLCDTCIAKTCGGNK